MNLHSLYDRIGEILEKKRLMKILVLEDDYSYRSSIKEYLLTLDYEIDDFENGDDALHAIFENTYDLLLMDIIVPGMSGYDILKEVRKHEIEVPIILVTSLTDIDDLSVGYELGCNDYIRKPFSLKELKYRITQAINSFHFKSTTNRIKLIEDYMFDLEKCELTRDNSYIKLTNIETKIIDFLIRRRGQFCTTQDMVVSIWDDDFISDADLRMHIKRIRDKTTKELIVNSRGLGYKIEKL